MSVVVDALGKQCPIPVVMAKKALAELQTPDTLEILVDNEAAVQNLSHSLLRSLINIQLVNIADTDYIYRNRQCFGKYFVIKLLALY